MVAIATVFTLARFSEAFLVLRAQSVGLPIMLVPAVMVVMNVVYAVAAYPAGILSDKIGRTGILATGFVILIFADIALALASGVPGVMAGVVLWGLHMGFTQGLLGHDDCRQRACRASRHGIRNVQSSWAAWPCSLPASSPGRSGML